MIFNITGFFCAFSMCSSIASFHYLFRLLCKCSDDQTTEHWIKVFNCLDRSLHFTRFMMCVYKCFLMLKTYISSFWRFLCFRYKTVYIRITASLQKNIDIQKKAHIQLSLLVPALSLYLHVFGHSATMFFFFLSIMSLDFSHRPKNVILCYLFIIMHSFINFVRWVFILFQTDSKFSFFFPTKIKEKLPHPIHLIFSILVLKGKERASRRNVSTNMHCTWTFDSIHFVGKFPTYKRLWYYMRLLTLFFPVLKSQIGREDEIQWRKTDISTSFRKWADQGNLQQSLFLRVNNLYKALVSRLGLINQR